MSRAQWLAYGSALVTLGCTSGAATGPSEAQDAQDATLQREAASQEVEASRLDDDAAQGDAAQGDAAIADGALDGTPSETGSSADGALSDATGDGVITFADTDGAFICPGSLGNWDSSVCDRAAQWCFVNGGGPGRAGCHSVDTTCIEDRVDWVGDAACSSAFYWDAAACDGGYRRCACLGFTGYCQFPAQCTDDDAGGVTVSCGHCYGAPPARLERLARARQVTVS